MARQKRDRKGNYRSIDQFIIMANAHIPMECPFCHKPIRTDTSLIIGDRGVYHPSCHLQAFPHEGIEMGNPQEFVTKRLTEIAKRAQTLRKDEKKGETGREWKNEESDNV